MTRLSTSLAAALSTVLAAGVTGVSPAAFADTPGEEVLFQVDLATSPKQMLEQIEAQAWAACRTARGDNSVSGRSHGQARCARRLTRDVISNLQVEPLTVYAKLVGKLSS